LQLLHGVSCFLSIPAESCCSCCMACAVQLLRCLSMCPAVYMDALACELQCVSFITLLWVLMPQARLAMHKGACKIRLVASVQVHAMIIIDSMMGSRAPFLSKCCCMLILHMYCIALNLPLNCAGHPSALVPWRSCRVLLNGQLRWMPPGAAVARAPATAVSRAARRGVILPGPFYVTTSQVGGWWVGGGCISLLRTTMQAAAGA
jgi:hypothetical protein